MKKLAEMTLAEKQALLVKANAKAPAPVKSISEMSLAEKQAIINQAKGRSPAIVEKPGQIIQEEHPDVSTLTRAKLKTFGNSPEAMAQGLVKDYPNLESSVAPNGQVLVRTKGAQNWNVLDPDTGFFSNPIEMGKDALEGLYDVGSGLVEGAGATAAGIAAGAGTAGVGAIPAAMGAGAALGAGNEALRQKIGQYLGIPQEVNMEDVGMSGAFGAASPLLLGTGGTLKNMGKNTLKNEVFQSGLVGTGGKKALAKTADVFTGISGDLFKRATKDPALMKSISETGEDVVANDAIANLFSKIDDRYEKLGTRINDELRQSGEMVDISNVKGKINKILGKVQDEVSPLGMTDLEKAKIAGIQNIQSKAFNRTQDVIAEGGDVKQIVNELPDKVPASEAFKMKEQFASMSDFLSDKFRSSKGEADKSLSTTAKAAYGETSEAISKALKQAPALNKEYKDTLKDIEFLKTKFKNPKAMVGDDLAFDEKGARQLYKIGGGGDRALERKVKSLDRQYGTNLTEESKNIAAANLMEDAGWFNKSVRGVTSTSRTNLGQMAGGAAGAGAAQYFSDGGLTPGWPTLVGGALGGLATSPRAFLNYMKAAEKTSKIPMGVRQSAWNLMQNQE